MRKYKRQIGRFRPLEKLGSRYSQALLFDQGISIDLNREIFEIYMSRCEDIPLILVILRERRE